MMEEDLQPRKPTASFASEPLDLMSIDELTARIEALKSEIARCEATVAAKSAQRAAADKLFGGGS